MLWFIFFFSFFPQSANWMNEVKIWVMKLMIYYTYNNDGSGCHMHMYVSNFYMEERLRYISTMYCNVLLKYFYYAQWADGRTERQWKIWVSPPLFINKRFALNKMFQWNASKFAIFYVHVVFFVFHFVQLYIFTLWMPWSMST